MCGWVGRRVHVHAWRGRGKGADGWVGGRMCMAG